MKTFKLLREAMKKGMPPGEHVYGKKIKGVALMVHEVKGRKPFVTYIDGEELDRFDKLKVAIKAGEEFIKAAKG